ncbi:MFS transporter [Pokkaliibacter sp. CJK22405]|uniref:MFS transporter n=1 Tax=Pokkaliibacter sp. CJK22405 TaxID=3384615 RepID=UPI003984F0E0
MSRLSEKLYQRLFAGEEQDAGREISAESEQRAPANFFRLLISQSFTKLGDELANAKTVLPWLITYLGAANGWVGLLVPVRESLSLVPQLLVAGWMRKQAYRKRVWLLGAWMQSGALIGMALCAVLLHGNPGALAVVLLLAVFSLGRSFCSVSSKDVMGKVIPKSRRGRLNGLASSSAGVITLLVGGALLFWQDQKGPAVYLSLLLAAGGVWLLSALLFSHIEEPASDTENDGNSVKALLGRLKLLTQDGIFLRYVLSRALFISSALAGPYYVLLAQQGQSSLSDAQVLGVLVLGSGFASAISSSIWGKMADRSSRRVMILAGLLAGALGLRVRQRLAGAAIPVARLYRFCGGVDRPCGHSCRSQNLYGRYGQRQSAHGLCGGKQYGDWRVTADQRCRRSA